MSDLEKTNDGKVVIDRAPMLLCLEAAWELDALARVLPALVPCVAEHTPADPHFVVVTPDPVQTFAEAQNALAMALHYLRQPSGNVPGALRKTVQALTALSALRSHEGGEA